MGIIDKFLSMFGGEQVNRESSRAVPFKITTSLSPVRLIARTQNSCDLILTVQNLESSPLMCSVVVDVPNSLGFDSMALHKKKELRLGSLEASKSRKITVPLCANNQTPAGTYRVFITMYSHYRDYTHVLNSVRKSIELRVV